jgi:hypothetical protein
MILLAASPGREGDHPQWMVPAPFFPKLK